VGSGDLRAVQQQQLALAAARTALLRVQGERLVQRVNLHLALGGGFEAPPTAPVRRSDLSTEEPSVPGARHCAGWRSDRPNRSMETMMGNRKDEKKAAAAKSAVAKAMVAAKPKQGVAGVAKAKAAGGDAPAAGEKLSNKQYEKELKSCTSSWSRCRSGSGKRA